MSTLTGVREKWWEPESEISTDSDLDDRKGGKWESSDFPSWAKSSLKSYKSQLEVLIIDIKALHQKDISK